MNGMTGIRPLVAGSRFQTAFAAQDLDGIMAAMTPDCVFDDTTPPDGVRHEGPDRVRAAWEHPAAMI
jgi:ketosteroid isomerase-like protein